MNIPEAAIDAAIDGFHNYRWQRTDHERENTLHMLEAAAPHIVRAVLDDLAYKTDQRFLEFYALADDDEAEYAAGLRSMANAVVTLLVQAREEL